MSSWSYGAEVNEKNVQGRTALLMAVDRENAEIIRTLLRNEADVDAITRSDNPALHRATLKRYNWIAGLLLEAGAKMIAMATTRDEVVLVVLVDEKTHGGRSR